MHLPLFNIDVPANASMLIENLLNIATFDIIESETAFGWLINFPEEDENSIIGNYNDSGYESAHTINLLGTSFIFIFSVCAVMVLLLITWPIKKLFGRFARFKKRHDSFTEAIYWNIWIRYMMEDSLGLLITVFCYYFRVNQ